MALVYGQAVAAAELEAIISADFDATRFAALCNAISWASSRNRASSVPSFTERVNVADQGVDAEWHCELSAETLSSPILGPGWNVHQYKQRDIRASNRKEIISKLGAGLKGSVKAIATAHGRYPDRYQIFTNIDLVHQQKSQLVNLALDGIDQNSTVQVDVIGAAELAAFLNDMPHLRSSFLGAGPFETWDDAWKAHSQKILSGGKNTNFYGQENVCNELKFLLDDQDTRLILLSGPHNIGKSRIVLEATATSSATTVWALDPDQLLASDIRAIETPQTTATVVVDDPSEEAIDRLGRYALGRPNLKLIITFPTSNEAAIPNVGIDGRAALVRVKPLDENDSRALLQDAGTGFDYGEESWVLHQAGGNPGILILAASIASTLRERSGNFTSAVAQALQRRVESLIGSGAVEALEILSLLTQTGVAGASEAEISALCSLLDSTGSTERVIYWMPSLHRSGLVRRMGDYVEVTPPLLANHLALALIRTQTETIIELVALLPSAGRLRLFRRLAELPPEYLKEFWEQVFGDGGLLSDFHSILENIQIFREVVVAAPELSSALILDGLNRLTIEERRQLDSGKRRDLIWSLEELLFRRISSRKALQSFGLLAEAESENISNNSTGVFAESFMALHIQLPLSLRERVEVLDELINRNTLESGSVAVQAIRKAMENRGSIILRQGTGSVPLDCRPSMTYGEVYDYMEEMADRLLELESHSEMNVRSEAAEVIPEALSNLESQGRRDTGINRLDQVLQRIRSGESEVPVDSISDALYFLDTKLNEAIVESEGELRAELETSQSRVVALRQQLDELPISQSIKRWAGGWTGEQHEIVSDQNENSVDRGEAELINLANAIARNPDLLGDSDVDWICSSAASKGQMLLYRIGEADRDRCLLQRMQQAIEDYADSVVPAHYFGGLAQHCAPEVRAILDEMTRSSDAPGPAILVGTHFLPADEGAIARVEALLREDRVSASLVETVLSSAGWVRGLDENLFARLLSAIAGPELQGAYPVIEFFGMWLHIGKNLDENLRSLAWECLKAAGGTNSNQDYRCDQLAAALSDHEPEAGFVFLESQLNRATNEDYWEPFSYGTKNRFFDALLKSDRYRALRIVFECADSSQTNRFRVSQHLREIVDQERDAEFLIEYGRMNAGRARVICASMSEALPGFWRVAYELIEEYFDNSDVLNALRGAIEQHGQTVMGPYSQFLISRADKVAQIRSALTTPPRVDEWLRATEDSIRKEAEANLISEMNEDVNRLGPYDDEPNSPERRWVLRTLVLHEKYESIERAFSRDELGGLLGRIELSRAQRYRVLRQLDLPRPSMAKKIREVFGALLERFSRALR